LNLYLTGSEICYFDIVLADGKRLKVKIPAGIKDKTKLRFKNLGGQSVGKGKPGDAYVEILIRPYQSTQLVAQSNQTLY
jgi:DnaJ-class molecular chaperone